MKIRKAKKEDIIFLYNLRNEPIVRQSAFNTDAVNWQTHQKWFDKKLRSKKTIILIAEKDSEEIGQIRFDFERKTKIAEVDIAIKAKWRGKGYGLKLLKQGCKYAFGALKIKEITAHIKAGNKISVRIFSKAGFSNYGFIEYNSHKCIEMRFKDDYKNRE